MFGEWICNVSENASTIEYSVKLFFPSLLFFLLNCLDKIAISEKAINSEQLARFHVQDGEVFWALC